MLCTGTILGCSKRPVIAAEVFVAVPVAAREAVVRAGPDLDEAHAALEQSAGDQAVSAEVADLLARVHGAFVFAVGRIEAVEVEDVLRFPAEIGQFGH